MTGDSQWGNNQFDDDLKYLSTMVSCDPVMARSEYLIQVFDPSTRSRSGRVGLLWLLGVWISLLVNFVSAREGGLCVRAGAQCRVRQRSSTHSLSGLGMPNVRQPSLYPSAEQTKSFLGKYAFGVRHLVGVSKNVVDRIPRLEAALARERSSEAASFPHITNSQQLPTTHRA
jgi:hypothetical protein